MRASIVLILALTVQAVCWIIVAGLRAAMNRTVPQFLFGLQISHDVSIGLCLLVLGGIPFSAITAVVAGVIVAKDRFSRGAGR